jgi:hypothetical protein
MAMRQNRRSSFLCASGRDFSLQLDDMEREKKDRQGYATLLTQKSGDNEKRRQDKA